MPSNKLFFYEFLTLSNVNASCRNSDLPAAHIVNWCSCGIGTDDGGNARIATVHASDWESTTSVMGEPNKVALSINGDLGNFVDCDTGIVHIVDVPVSTIEADKPDVASGS